MSFLQFKNKEKPFKMRFLKGLKMDFLEPILVRLPYLLG